MSRLGRGQSLIALGETERGVAFLDEAMVAVIVRRGVADRDRHRVLRVDRGVRRDLRPPPGAGVDRRRSAQLVRVASRTSSRSAASCLVYRAELMRFHGDWSAASDEARQRARSGCSRPPPEPAVGEAHYQQAELHRLRGEFAAAEAAYREAQPVGPPPGARPRAAPAGPGRRSGGRRHDPARRRRGARRHRPRARLAAEPGARSRSRPATWRAARERRSTSLRLA